MEVKSLRKISGAWTEKGQSQFMRLGVRAEYDFSLVTPRIQRPVIKGIRTGVLNSTGGQAASVYRVLCEAFGLKYVCASKNGQRLYTNFNNMKFYEACIALNSLVSKNGRGGQYIHSYAKSIVCHSWLAKDQATRNLFSETIGFPDKELREEASDFLSSGNKLVQTWVDRNPI